MWAANSYRGSPILAHNTVLKYNCGVDKLDRMNRELCMHGKAMVPYVQLSTNCDLDSFNIVKNIFSLHQKHS